MLWKCVQFLVLSSVNGGRARDVTAARRLTQKLKRKGCDGAGPARDRRDRCESRTTNPIWSRSFAAMTTRAVGSRWGAFRKQTGKQENAAAPDAGAARRVPEITGLGRGKRARLKLKGELAELDIKCNDLRDQRDRLQRLGNGTDDWRNQYARSLLRIEALREELQNSRIRTLKLQHHWI
ncbi:hypothetical protein EVAR_23565_1 [Eumeta japonica]|uniref:Uncharacterized protein n=1 Tax=Eumeta variegata TaxID=151549 RepID=A0A4C1X094_EUMVA|nr:hypothetical protein EVAR_23565_1 [Eumeta japonica]